MKESRVHYSTSAASDTSRDTPADAEVPPIPVRLAHRPTIGGLVVPYLTPHTDDGRYLFGGVDPHRQWQCLNRRLCSVCGRALAGQPGDRLILLMRLSDLPQQRTSEPALELFISTRPPTAHRAACPAVPVWVIFTEQDRGGHGAGGGRCRRVGRAAVAAGRRGG
jgi:hypothetical protein